jgi:hypothetical protein
MAQQMSIEDAERVIEAIKAAPDCSIHAKRVMTACSSCGTIDCCYEYNKLHNICYCWCDYSSDYGSSY